MVRERVRTALGIVIIATLDLGAGYWARHALRLGHTDKILGRWVGLHLLYNTGAMLGLGSRIPWLITGVGVAGVAVLTIWAWKSPTHSWPLALMAGGALGNLLSRLIWHRVTDYMMVAGYPGIFNVSDVALRVGVVWLIWDLVRQVRRLPDPAAPKTGGGSAPS